MDGGTKYKEFTQSRYQIACAREGYKKNGTCVGREGACGKKRGGALNVTENQKEEERIGAEFNSKARKPKQSSRGGT